MSTAWHFLREDKRLGYDDGRLVRRGHTFKCDPDKLALCNYGFHGSAKIMDALGYAPGPVICRVKLGGKIIRGDDKLVASERTVLEMADATDVLHEMACWCAEQALALVKNPDPRSIAAIEAKRAWMRGEISDGELAAVRGPALAAYWAAYWAASRAASRAAYWAASRAAYWAASRAAYWAASEAASRAAARAAQEKHLINLVKEILT